MVQHVIVNCRCLSEILLILLPPIFGNNSGIVNRWNRWVKNLQKRQINMIKLGGLLSTGLSVDKSESLGWCFPDKIE